MMAALIGLAAWVGLCVLTLAWLLIAARLSEDYYNPPTDQELEDFLRRLGA